MNITASKQANILIQVIGNDFSFKKTDENKAAVRGIRLIIINALATLVNAKAKIKVTLPPKTHNAFKIPGVPIL